jgi:hypothetical protein
MEASALGAALTAGGAAALDATLIAGGGAALGAALAEAALLVVADGASRGSLARGGATAWASDLGPPHAESAAPTASTPTARTQDWRFDSCGSLPQAARLVRMIFLLYLKRTPASHPICSGG